MDIKEEKLIKLIRKIRLYDEFKIPEPSATDDENSYMAKCMSIASKEFPHEQAVAICQQQWNDR